MEKETFECVLRAWDFVAGVLGGGTCTTTRSRIGRLNADGSVDTSFNPGGRLNADRSLDTSSTQ